MDRMQGCEQIYRYATGLDGTLVRLGARAYNPTPEKVAAHTQEPVGGFLGSIGSRLRWDGRGYGRQHHASHNMNKKPLVWRWQGFGFNHGIWIEGLSHVQRPCGWEWGKEFRPT